MRKILNWLKKEYNNVAVYVTENGISDKNGTLRDYHRIHYYRLYINEMLKGNSEKVALNIIYLINDTVSYNTFYCLFLAVFISSNPTIDGCS